jgi:hypothetical protein
MLFGTVSFTNESTYTNTRKKKKEKRKKKDMVPKNRLVKLTTINL